MTRKVRTGLWLVPSTDFSELEGMPIGMPGNPRETAMSFLHGTCSVFALALHERFGYAIEWTLEEEYDQADDPGSPWDYLVHAYCIDGDENLIDVRGLTCDAPGFFEEFEDFVTYPATWHSPPDAREIESECIRTMGRDTFDAYLKAAFALIDAHPDWYATPTKGGKTS